MDRRKTVYLIAIMVLLCCVVLITMILLPGCNGGDNSSASSAEVSEPASVTEESSGEASTAFAESSDPELSSEDASGDDSSADTSEESMTEEVSYAIDITPYLPYIEPEDDAQFTYLVNKNTDSLGSEFVPKDLVLASVAREGREKHCKMDKTAAMALEAFLKEAAFYGYGDISMTNAYRSYDYQYWLFYDYYFKLESAEHPGESKQQILDRVAFYSFPPGNSEHQTGLCCDMHNKSVGSEEKFNHTAAATWLEENAWRFGYILRYPEGKESVTGCEYESWHFRFVGRRLATILHKTGQTLDEYYGILG